MQNLEFRMRARFTSIQTASKKNKEAPGKTEDWAILPFDETEDDAGWTKLINETGKLSEDADKIEVVYGELLMENRLSDINLQEERPDDELF